MLSFLYKTHASLKTAVVHNLENNKNKNYKIMHNVRLDGQTCRALKLKFSVVKSSKVLISEKKKQYNDAPNKEKASQILSI